MFQVEPILWLQAHSSTALTWLLTAFTLLGYAPAYVAAILTLAFGVRLRPGLAVLVTLLVCGLLTEGLKSGLALPRPYSVDARVLAPAVVPGAAPHVSAVSAVTRGGAASFWGLPSPEAVAAVRSLEPNYGFPSGHASAAVAFVLATAFYFGWRRLATLGLAWPLAMGLSRMYLGRHFLADVLGGLAVGCVAFGAAALLVRRSDDGSAGNGHLPLRLRLLVAIGVLLACVVPWVPWLDPAYAGRLAGAAAACAFLQGRGFPDDAGTLARRGGRVAVSAAILLLAWRASAMLLAAAGWEHERPAVMLADAVVLLLTLVGGVAIARRHGWYARR